MTMPWVWLYRTPSGVVAAEHHITDAPMLGAFLHRDEQWHALGFGRMVQRRKLSVIQPISLAILRAAADRLDSAGRA